jgi:hypothetical protein
MLHFNLLCKTLLLKFMMLKKLPENALDFLLNLYNQILSTGIIQSFLKPGKNPNQANSYRPISFLYEENFRENAMHGVGLLG